MTLHLHKDESAILEVDLHWSTYIVTGTWAFFGIFGLIGVLAAPKQSETPLIVEVLTTTTMFFGPLIWKHLSNRCKTYAITNQRVYFEEGILSKTKLDIPYNKINDIQMTQSLPQRLFGTGNILLYTGNSIPVTIKDIDRPNQFKEELFEIVSQNSKKAV